MNPAVIVVASDQFIGTAATAIAELIGSTTATQGECSLALCGGHTPASVYYDLVGHVLDWSGVSIWFGDERAVPPDHPDSNFGMARRTLLDHLPIPPERIHRMPAERADLDAAAWEYDRSLPARFDVLLLGMGPDGHTASLFPGSPALLVADRRVVAVGSPSLPIQPQVGRLTITPPVIAAAREIVVMVRGSDKASTLHQVLDGPEQPTKLPAQLARRGTWIIDQAAAAQLQRRDN